MMISVDEALQIIERETPPLGSERVELAHALNRVIAEDIVADTDMPPFDRSQMDGYAVKASDTQNTPAKLTLIGESAAGRGFSGAISPGEAVRIMTGAPVPAGADAVQKIELTSETEDFVTIHEPTSEGRYIVPRAAEVQKGATVIARGELLSPISVAVPAAFGYANINVAKQPRVAILATGTEIVDISSKPNPDQIRNSNSLMLAALCSQAGAIPHILPTAGDDLAQLKQIIAEATQDCDILITTGGVSVGKYDLTKAALTELGAQLYFEKLRLKPGKPTVFAKLNKTFVFGLPGNPVSAAVTYYLFVRTAIRLMQSARETQLPAGHAILTGDVKAAPKRTTYLPATLATDAAGRLLATPLRWQGSSDFTTFAQTQALIIIPENTTIPSNTPAKIIHLPTP